MSTDVFGDTFRGNGVGQARSYFKPADHLGTYVLMIEPRTYRPDAPNPNEPGTTRPELVADVTSFASEAHLASKAPTEYPGVVINQPYLANDLASSLGKVEVCKLAQQPSKTPGRRASWVWRAVEGEVVEQVKAFYLAREASIAETLANDETPDYLK